MRILFVYRFLTLGGVEEVLLARLYGASPRGIEAHAWFFHDLGGRPVFHGVGDRVHVGDPESCLRFLERGGFDLAASIDTEEILPVFEGRSRPRLVLECHTPYTENLEYLRRLGSCRPAAFFVPSHHQREVVLERVGEGASVQVIPNPLRQEFVEDPRPFQSPPVRPVVAWIGRMDSLKNWKGFVRLAGTLERNGLPAQFWMAGGFVGNGGSEDLLRNAREEGILGRLRWFRNLPHVRVPAFLDAVRDSGGVVVSTSRGESFGMTVAEAMARACAVAVPGRPPFTEFVEEGRTGSFLPPGPAEMGADQVAALLADPGLRAAYGRQARESVLARFAPEPALAELARALREVAGN
jgi:glycosyltransferase involved in cell wall biosynthesis